MRAKQARLQLAERERFIQPRDVRPVVADAVRHILEASLGDEGQPPRRVALALQLVALAVNDRLTLPLTVPSLLA